ncbi:SGNH/GDSL hydrolase family protein [Phormidium sp. FACHB-592]|nr:SGNH/GDSL hydrolase family protein [Phormidium sp. FACHB-592]
MKKLTVVIVLFLLTLMTAVVFSAKQTHPLAELYVFGDSLSDTGTVFRATGGLYPSHPPYFQGRYSNGRVWVEYLAEQFAVKHVNNFACGGATTGGSDGGLVPGLLSQVQTFTQTHTSSHPDTLYILWAGANDYLQGVTDTALPVANITNAIESLARSGATKLLVANLPDLGQLPATRHGSNASALSTLTQAHNAGLRRALKVLQQQYQALQLVTFDANLLYQQAMTEPAKFGLTQVTHACLSGSGPCSKPDQFLFWDSIHPTTAGHRILANTSVAALKRQFLLPNTL